MGSEWLWIFGVLALGVEVGRLLTDRHSPNRPGTLQPLSAGDFVTRPQLDAEIARLERTLTLEWTDAVDKLEHLDDRIRQRHAKASGKPQERVQGDGEAQESTQDRARAKLAAMRLKTLGGGIQS